MGDPAVVLLLYCMPDDASRCVSLQLHDAVNLTVVVVFIVYSCIVSSFLKIITFVLYSTVQVILSSSGTREAFASFSTKISLRSKLKNTKSSIAEMKKIAV